MSKELLLLKTSASSSIRGYNYQFLKTLEVWVNNYINYGDEVFCENEDDFVEKHLDSKIYRFNQIKCYTNEFSLDSDAIKKSLCNFFKIYRSFDKEGYKLEFRLQSNSKPKDGNILSDWFKNQDSLSEELHNSIEKRLELILEINHEQVDKSNLRAFIECVKWSFENLDPETSINELIDKIKGLLLKIPDSDIVQSQTDLIFSKLYFEVVQKCSLPDGKLRRLTHENLIDSISHEEDAWYVKTKEDWKEYQTEKYTFGDFIAIRIAAVHSMYTKYLHNDIEFWIRILENVVLREDKNSAIKRQAIYEMSL